MKSKIKSILAAFLMLTSFSFGLVACDDDDNHANVPSEFEAALKQQYPDAKNVEWERKGKYRVAEFVIKRSGIRHLVRPVGQMRYDRTRLR